MKSLNVVLKDLKKMDRDGDNTNDFYFNALGQIQQQNNNTNNGRNVISPAKTKALIAALTSKYFNASLACTQKMEETFPTLRSDLLINNASVINDRGEMVFYTRTLNISMMYLQDQVFNRDTEKNPAPYRFFVTFPDVSFLYGKISFNSLLHVTKNSDSGMLNAMEGTIVNDRPHDNYFYFSMEIVGAKKNMTAKMDFFVSPEVMFDRMPDAVKKDIIDLTSSQTAGGGGSRGRRTRVQKL